MPNQKNDDDNKIDISGIDAELKKCVSCHKYVLFIVK